MSQDLNQFLHGVQGKAYAQAVHAVRHRDEALDLVQDSMLKLAKTYANRDSAEWPMLFQRILQNKIRDWYRKQKVRSILVWWEQQPNDAEAGPDFAPSAIESPQEMLENERSLAGIGNAVNELPIRQQQVFLLRALWGHSNDEIAEILSCGAATVKTHYARAVKALKQQLEVSI